MIALNPFTASHLLNNVFISWNNAPNEQLAICLVCRSSTDLGSDFFSLCNESCQGSFGQHRALFVELLRSKTHRSLSLPSSPTCNPQESEEARNITEKRLRSKPPSTRKVEHICWFGSRKVNFAHQRWHACLSLKETIQSQSWHSRLLPKMSRSSGLHRNTKFRGNQTLPIFLAENWLHICTEVYPKNCFRK